jgi:hypothetical protein
MHIIICISSNAFHHISPNNCICASLHITICIKVKLFCWGGDLLAPLEKISNVLNFSIIIWNYYEQITCWQKIRALRMKIYQFIEGFSSINNFSRFFWKCSPFPKMFIAQSIAQQLCHFFSKWSNIPLLKMIRVSTVWNN